MDVIQEQHIDAQIEVTDKLIKEHQQRKSQLQRQRNAIFDPLARLPTELSTSIFLEALPQRPSPSREHAPLLLLNVCTAWTAIALSVGALWANIRVPCPCPEGVAECLKMWLHRARGNSLSVTIRGRHECGDVPAFIWKHSLRLKQLTFAEAGIDANIPCGLIDLFGMQTPETLPLLEVLKIQSSGVEEDSYDCGQILALLGMATNLIEFACQVCCVSETEEDVSEYPEPYGMLTLPALRRVMCGGQGTRASSDDTILKFLTLPALETLSLSLSSLCDTDLVQLFRRSSPPLKVLCIGHDGDSVDLPAFRDCVGVIPTLESLKLTGVGPCMLEHILTVLACSSDLVPRLHTLTIPTVHRGTVRSIEPVWEQLLLALSSRPALQTVSVELNAGIVKPSPCTLAKFGDLVARGRRIHISRVKSGRNLVL